MSEASLRRRRAPISASRGLVRTSVNPDCHLQAAMAVERRDEAEFFHEVTGKEYEGEVGERESARRRGAKFETNNRANNAAALRKRLGPLIGVDPEEMLVRDLSIEAPGAVAQLTRLQRTRASIKDALLNRPGAPHLIISPVLELPVLSKRDGTAMTVRIEPDFLLLDPARRVYRVGEEKSFIERQRGDVDPGDLDRSRRQSAAGILALEADLERPELARLRLTSMIDPTGVFVFATPFGMAPAEPHLESLLGEIEQIRRAIITLQRVARILARERAKGVHQLGALADELPTSLRESCYGTCILTSYCEGRPENRNARLGNGAKRLFGEFDMTAVAGLIARPEGLVGREAAIARRLQRTAAQLGFASIDELVQEIS